MSAQNTDIWNKFVKYLTEMSPKIYISKSVRILAQEALKHAPDDERLKAINEFIAIVARPEAQSERSKFTF